MKIVVYGSPAPQGSKAFKGMHGGHAVLVESSKAVKPWRLDVKLAAIDAHAGNAPMDGPLHVRMVFTLRKPASAPKKRRTWPDRKPDLSKLIRSTEDALTDAGVIANDARIVSLTAWKVFPGEDPEALHIPGVVIEIVPASEQLRGTA